MLYQIFKYLHILLAITAVGANLTYGVWIARATRDKAALPFTLRGVKLIDDRIANPAYGLLLVTGLVMVFVGDLPLTTPWLALALGLYAVLLALGAAGYTPTLRKQIALAESDGPESAAYLAVARRGTLLGILLAVDVVVIIYLMVMKPALWG
jgi:uncharacterized membrane protein